MRIIVKTFAVSVLLGAVATGCALSQKLDGIQAHLTAIDQRLDAQDRFLEDVEVRLFLEVRKIRNSLRGLNKYVDGELKQVRDAFEGVREQIREATSGIQRSLPGWPK